MASRQLTYQDGPEIWADAFLLSIHENGKDLDDDAVIGVVSGWFKAALNMAYLAGRADEKYVATYYHGAEY